MITFSMNVNLMGDEFTDAYGKVNSTALANVIRRVGHTVEGRKAQIGDEGVIRDERLKEVGKWIIQ